MFNEDRDYKFRDDVEDDDYENIDKSDLELKTSYNQDKLILKEESFRIEYLKQVLEGKVDSIKLDTEIDIQRDWVWDSTKKNKLIDSIFLGIPINYIWIAKLAIKRNGNRNNDIETHVVIDGKQRLKTIYSFLNNEFSLKKEYMTSFKKQNQTKLISNKKFTELEKYLRILFLESKVLFKIIEINDTDSEEIIWEIFTRINENCPLSKQEIRNAAYSSKFNLVLKKELKNNKIYKKCFSERNHLRLKSSELIYRFLGGVDCFNFKNKNYLSLPNVAERIVKFMKKAQSFKDEEINEWIKKLNQTVDKIVLVFKNNSFNKWSDEKNKNKFEYKSALNVPLAEMQLFTFYTLDLEFVKKYCLEIENAYKKLFEENPDDFLLDLRAATGDPKKMEKRINLFLEYINNETRS